MEDFINGIEIENGNSADFDFLHNPNPEKQSGKKEEEFELEGEGADIDESSEEEAAEVETSEDEEEGQVTDEDEYSEESDDSHEQGSKTVPLKTYLKDRKKFQAKMSDLTPMAELGQLLMDQYGVTADKLPEFVSQLRAKELAEKEGITEEEAGRIVKNDVEAAQIKRERATLVMEREADALKGSAIYTALSNKSDREEVIQTAISKGLTVKEAYRVLFGDRYERDFKKAKPRDKGLGRGKGKPKGNGGAKAHGLSEDEMMAARLSGMTPEDYARNKA